MALKKSRHIISENASYNEIKESEKTIAECEKHDYANYPKQTDNHNIRHHVSTPFIFNLS